MKPILQLFLLTLLVASITLVTLSASAQVTSPQSGYDPAASSEPAPSPPKEQSIKFDHLSIEHGLSNNNVPGIVQDDKGFMWFGTYDRLNRYDGREFKVYQHDSEDPSSLSSNSIRILYKDRMGNIWIGTWGSGLNKFVRETETFIRFQHDPQDPQSLSHNGIRSIYQDRSGTLWIGTDGGGLNRLDPKTKQFTHYRHDPDDPRSLGHNVIFAIYEDRAGALWVGTEGGGLNRFDAESATFIRYQNDPNDPQSLSHNKVRAIFEDRKGRFWIGTFGGGLNQFDRKTEIFTNYRHDPANPNSLNQNNITTIYEDRAGAFWIGTRGGGLNRFDRETGHFKHYPHDSADPNSLSHDTVYTIYEDLTGALWIGTNGGGINRLDRERRPFMHYQNNPADPNSLSYNGVWSFYEDQIGALWIGTNGGGLNRFDQKTETFTHYQHDPADPNSLSSNIIYAIFVDQAGVIWIGTFGGGLNRFDWETRTFTHYRHNPDDPYSLSDDGIMSIYEDQSGILWVGTWTGGLNRFDRETQRFTHFQHNAADPNSLSHNNVMSIHEDQTGALWIGTMNGGLNRFDRNTETFRRYQHDPDNPSSLSHNGIVIIYKDRANALWIGTNSGGLNKFDRTRGHFIRYGEKDGLPSDSVRGILEDEQGNLWLSTAQGLSKFNPQTETFKNYDASDRLQSDQFNYRSHYKSRNGQMFFGGPNGFNAFYPDHIKDNPHIPPVVITDFQLSNKPLPIGSDSVLKQSIVETDHLPLSYLNRVISFKFAALNYQSPEKNRYRYKMEGFEDDWNEVDSTRRFTTYTNLDPGQYMFRVIGSNNDGVWNEEGTSIKITVTPPWWWTWWFRFGMLLLLAGLVVGGFVWQRQSARRRERHLETQVAERTRDLEIAKEKAEAANKAKSIFLANMGHELRTPLNAILGTGQLMARDTGFPEKYKDNLGILSRSGEYLLGLINDVLEISRIEAGRLALNKSVFSLKSTLTLVEELILPRTEKKGLELSVDYDPNLPEYIRSDETKILQILGNLLDNAIKYTKAGTITLRAISQPPAVSDQSSVVNLQFKVEDTGVGISPENQHNIFEHFTQVMEAAKFSEGAGLGLSICRHYAELMGGSISFKSQPQQGSIFTVELPVEIVDESETRVISLTRRVIGLEPGQPKFRILIAEDKPDSRFVLGQLIENAGFNVIEATNGQEVIEQYNIQKPDLIWMDIRMPVMSGLEATKQIRDQEDQSKIRDPKSKIKKVPIIALSASAYEEDRENFLAAGCDDFVRKPFLEEEVFNKMAQYLGVRYIYQDFETPVEKPVKPALTSTDLVDLPKDLVQRINEAAKGAASKKLLELMQQIPPDFVHVAEALSDLVSQYQFSTVIALTEKENKDG